ncbi:Predicted arabinose efflux permease, MFS family [Actinopolyspora alba]|uniref:Predicted arabinose efflux permease, MFS family n=1 Tax=Actinopolyspora alba TaxID=673379 RepID=A0A1I1TKB1_9ACTN|nr:MFS transporter [Actinopolyspora alba]SFD58957.1 Predicted arabinose efflux permease, MFS family [Actinopolyspora alba]
MPIAVYVLGLGIFALVTSELQVTGMMPAMAQELGVSVSRVGYLISLYALAMAIGGPLLNTALLRLPRRWALMVLFGAFVTGEVLGALSPGYGSLLVARLITGAVSGAFFGVAIAAAIQLAGPNVAARASSVVLSGLMAGTVLGLPLANYIGSSFGWRMSFWIVAVMAITVGALTALVVPRLQASQYTSVRSEIAAFQNWRLWAVYSTSTLVIGATYAAFSYFTPILSEVTDLGATTVTTLLFAYGAATILGNHIVGRLADTRAISTLTAGVVSLIVLLIVFGLFTTRPPAVVLALIGIGLVGVTMNPALVARVMGTANGGSLVNTVHTSCITMGVVFGSWVGGLGISAGYGLRAPLWIGAVIAVAGFLTLLPDILSRGAFSGTNAAPDSGSEPVAEAADSMSTADITRESR